MGVGSKAAAETLLTDRCSPGISSIWVRMSARAVFRPPQLCTDFMETFPFCLGITQRPSVCASPQHLLLALEFKL